MARAQKRGYRVLSSRPAEAEAKLSYAGVADLFREVDEHALVQLPRPQRRALQVAMLQADPDGSVDQRAVAAAVASIVLAAGSERPLVIAVDDVQWLDSPSARALAFAARRLEASQVGFLLSRRSDPGAPVPLGLDRALAEALRSLTVGPLSLGALRELLRVRLSLRPSRPVLLAVERASGGNPLFALEIARAVAETGAEYDGTLPLPEQFTVLVRERIERLPPRTRKALHVVSALTEPTMTLVERAEIRASALEPAETAGVVELKDGLVRFTHPLVRSSVYQSLSDWRRRELHRRLAAVVVDPEERARHLALGCGAPDATVAAVLDRTAARARARGAPDAAADLLERAIALTPATGKNARRRRMFAAAEDHFYAGDRGRARVLLEQLLNELPPTPQRADALHLLAELNYYDDSWPAALPLLEEALDLAGADDRRRTRIELDLCYAVFNTGDAPKAGAYAAAALEHAEAAGDPGLLAQAIAINQSAAFALDGGADTEMLDRALALENRDARTIVALTPSWLVAGLYLLTGQLERAHALLEDLRTRLVERGRDSDLPATAAVTVWTECLRGEFDLAQTLGEQAVSDSLELESTTTRALALGARAMAASFRGAVDSARRDGEQALALCRKIGWTFGTLFPLWTLAFVALSVGDAAGAHTLLGPLADLVSNVGINEPMNVPYLPDEIEALILLGLLDQAQLLLDPFDRRGRELDRPWAFVTAARCRGLLLAARGDPAGAAAVLEQALTNQQSVDMPFEFARTQLVLGQVQRRLRQKRAAKETLEAAKETFDRLGVAIWSGKAAGEIERLGLRKPAAGKDGAELTETEKRVAALAARGLTNREIAGELFISPKTVQANLSKVYEKLGIHSRAELGARVAQGVPLQM